MTPRQERILLYLMTAGMIALWMHWVINGFPNLGE